MEQSKWENMERIFIQMRFDIENPNNEQIADSIIQSITQNSTNLELYKSISTLMPEWKTNLISSSPNQKNISCSKEIILFIIKSLEFFKKYLQTQQYQISCDIVDILQGLYGIVLTNSKKSLKQYWKIYIAPFHKKYHFTLFQEFKNTFLKPSTAMEEEDWNYSSSASLSPKSKNPASKPFPNSDAGFSYFILF